MPKLTLSVDPQVAVRAKRYAKSHGVSVSSMVEAYLSAVSGPAPAAERDAPILRSLRGILKEGDLRDYRRHLAAKYRC